MTDTPNAGETEAQEKALEQPIVKTEDNSAELERLRKVAAQNEMRANQVSNELQKLKDADAAAKQKQLEEQEEYKTLYEQSEQRRKEAEEALDLKDKTAEIEKAEKDISSKYSAEALEVAGVAGLKLTDSSEEAVADFTAKLDKIAEKVTAKGAVTPNNPGSTASTATIDELVARAKEDPKVMDEAISQLNFVKSNRKNA